MGNKDLIHKIVIIQKSASDWYRVQHPWQLLSGELPQVGRDSGCGRRTGGGGALTVHQSHARRPQPEVLCSAAAVWTPVICIGQRSELTIGVCSLGGVLERKDKRALFLVGLGGQGPPRRRVGFPF